MEYTALWGPKGFIVSPSKIVPLMNLSTSFSVKADNGNDANGTSSTNTKGKELQTVSLSTLYVRGAGVDPRGQIAEWEAQVGKSHPLYIQGQRFGPSKLMLKSVDVSDVLLSNTGKFLQCAIALTFEENANETTTVSKNSTSTNKGTQKVIALTATARKSDKAAKKATTEVMLLK